MYGDISLYRPRSQKASLDTRAGEAGVRCRLNPPNILMFKRKLRQEEHFRLTLEKPSGVTAMTPGLLFKKTEEK